MQEGARYRRGGTGLGMVKTIPYEKSDSLLVGSGLDCAAEGAEKGFGVQSPRPPCEAQGVARRAGGSCPTCCFTVHR